MQRRRGELFFASGFELASSNTLGIPRDQRHLGSNRGQCYRPEPLREPDCAASDHCCAAAAQDPAADVADATEHYRSPGAVPRGILSTSTRRKRQPPARQAKWQRPCARCRKEHNRGQQPCSSRTTPCGATSATRRRRRGPRTGGRRPCAREVASATPRRRAKASSQDEGGGRRSPDLDPGAAPAPSRRAPARAR